MFAQGKRTWPDIRRSRNVRVSGVATLPCKFEIASHVEWAEGARIDGCRESQYSGLASSSSSKMCAFWQTCDPIDTALYHPPANRVRKDSVPIIVIDRATTGAKWRHTRGRTSSKAIDTPRLPDDILSGQWNWHRRPAACWICAGSRSVIHRP